MKIYEVSYRNKNEKLIVGYYSTLKKQKIIVDSLKITNMDGN